MDDNDSLWLVIRVILVGSFRLLLLLLELRIGIALLQLAHCLLTLPLRRAERARMFLDLLETTMKQGRPLEETLISLAHSRDESMGLKFHVLAAWLETGLSLEEALARVPGFLPPQVTTMLNAGKQMGNVAKVLPACRQLLKDSISQIRGAQSYLVIMTFVIAPLGCFVMELMMVFVVPKFKDVFAGLGLSSGTALMGFVAANSSKIMLVQAVVMLLVWLAALIYVGGPRVTAWFPILERLHYRLPWRRRRMQRDFSTMLAVLLDAGVPEAAALTLAADCTANSVFRRRAARAVESLRQGMKLPDAVQLLDDAGEFRWRLRNAVAAPGGFFRALAGWHESLDARAFQQEQAAAHVITTALVGWAGLFVAVIAIAAFAPLASMINNLALW
jgi:type II secretory pathway component PulF